MTSGINKINKINKINIYIYFISGPQDRINKINKINIYFFIYLYLFCFEAPVTKDLEITKYLILS